MPHRKKCSECEYFIPIAHDPGWGICNAKAPRPVVNDLNRGSFVEVAYPKMHADHPCCGEART